MNDLPWIVGVSVAEVNLKTRQRQMSGGELDSRAAKRSFASGLVTPPANRLLEMGTMMNEGFASSWTGLTRDEVVAQIEASGDCRKERLTSRPSRSNEFDGWWRMADPDLW
jgi:hypothetical protein